MDRNAELPQDINDRLRKEVQVVGGGAIVFDDQVGAQLELVGGKCKSELAMMEWLRIEAKEWAEYEKGGLVRKHCNISVPQFFAVSPEIDLDKNYHLILKIAENLGIETAAVRSSHVHEGIGFDGIFETKRNTPRNEIVDAIHYVRESALTERSLAYAKEKGIALDGRMPVMVQFDLGDTDYTGLIFSKFPCPKDALKAKVRTNDGKEGAYAYERRTSRDGGIFINRLLVPSNVLSEYRLSDLHTIAQRVADFEERFGYAIKVEFALDVGSVRRDAARGAFLLQATRINNIDDAERFVVPQLSSKGFLASSNMVNGVGDVTGEAYVCPFDSQADSCIHWISKGELQKLKDFDEKHNDGYILLAPFVVAIRSALGKKYFYDLDNLTPHKKAVITYTDLSVTGSITDIKTDHDFERAREKGLLYLNFGSRTNNGIDRLNVLDGKFSREPNLRTGDTLRVVSDGITGSVYKLDKSE